MRRMVGFGFASILALAVGGWAQSGGKKDKPAEAKGRVERTDKASKPASKSEPNRKASNAADSARAESLGRARLEQWKLRVDEARKEERERYLAGLTPERRAKVEAAERREEVQRRKRDSAALAYMGEVRARVQEGAGKGKSGVGSLTPPKVEREDEKRKGKKK